jgi:hypothetical protein
MKFNEHLTTLTVVFLLIFTKTILFIAFVNLIIFPIVFIHGDEEGELLCTTLPVVIATAAAVVFLQLCIIVTCLLCLYTAKRGKKAQEHRASHSDRQSLRSSSRSSSTSSSHHGISTLYHDQLTYR